jgi:hypothetical protein
MLMLAVIGLTSAAIMRVATSTGQSVTNHRLLIQAGQSAQVALGFCESQLTMPAGGSRVSAWPVSAPPAWTLRADWTGGGAAPAHTLAPTELNAAVAPRVPPQCLVEATAIADVYTVTARGFSPDFSADPATGALRAGAVVWLQSTVLLDKPPAGAAEPRAAVSASPGAGAIVTAAPVPPPADACRGDCLPAIRQRAWQRLLTPPF